MWSVFSRFRLSSTALHDVAPRRALLHAGVVHRHAELGGEHDVLALVAEHLAHRGLRAAAIAVDVGGVEQRDAEVDRLVDHLARAFDIERAGRNCCSRCRLPRREGLSCRDCEFPWTCPFSCSCEVVLTKILVGRPAFWEISATVWQEASMAQNPADPTIFRGAGNNVGRQIEAGTASISLSGSPAVCAGGALRSAPSRHAAYRGFRAARDFLAVCADAIGDGLAPARDHVDRAGAQHTNQMRDRDRYRRTRRRARARHG